MPSKVQAYLAAGRPIIACLNGEGARLVAAAGAGLTVPAGDGQALAAAVLEMARMETAQRDAMGQLGSEFHQKDFSHDMLVDQLCSLLHGAASKGA